MQEEKLKILIPKVSIITVYYNRDYCVLDSVQSLLNQSFKDFELLLVDDGSTDNTLSKFKEFSDPRIRIISHLNMGFTSSIKKAVDLATGEFIAIHGSGDISLKSRINEQVQVLESEKDVKIVGCYVRNIYPNSNKCKIKIPNEYYTRNIFFKFNPIEHGSAMFRRVDYYKSGGYRLSIHYAQDLDLWLRLSREGRVKIINNILYESIILSDGVTYFPKKAIKQYQYAWLIRYLASCDSTTANSKLNTLDREGINNLVPISNFFVQKKLFKKFNSLVVFQNIKEVDDFISNSNLFLKLYYRIVFNLSRTTFFNRILKVLHKYVYLRIVKRNINAVQSSDF